MSLCFLSRLHDFICLFGIIGVGISWVGEWGAGYDVFYTNNIFKTYVGIDVMN